jgi:hypothetical protein
VSNIKEWRVKMCRCEVCLCFFGWVTGSVNDMKEWRVNGCRCEVCLSRALDEQRTLQVTSGG